MTKRNMRISIALVVALVPKLASAQHDEHQMPGMQAQSAELTQCLRVQPAIQNVIAGAMARAEAARLSNSPADLRAGLDLLEAALRDVRAQSEPCSAAAASSEPHAGHTMPGMQSPSSAPADQPMVTPSDAHAGHTMPSTQSPAGAPDPHAGHTMPPASPAPKAPGTAKPAPRGSAKPAASEEHARHVMPGMAPAAKNTPSKSEAVKPAETKSTDPHAGHAGHGAAQAGEQPADGKQMDPVTGLMVDPANAPNTTYQGQTYYFSSEQSKKEFLENPAKFAKKPKG